MRWNISQPGQRDPRFTDLLAAIVLVILIVAAAWIFFNGDASRRSNAAFIVPSQHVRW